jgi:archaellum component FlaG (FlaF/FlaG flagellin family)
VREHAVSDNVMTIVAVVVSAAVALLLYHAAPSIVCSQQTPVCAATAVLALRCVVVRL